MKHVYLITILAFFGCTEKQSDTADTAQDTGAEEDIGDGEDAADTSELACNMSIPTSFTSVEEYELGMTSDGVAMGSWQISFKPELFEWYYSDIVQLGAYTCSGNEIIGEDINFVGIYDPEERILIWDDILYFEDP